MQNEVLSSTDLECEPHILNGRDSLLYANLVQCDLAARFCWSHESDC